MNAMDQKDLFNLGLTSQKAEELLKTYGYNEIKQTRQLSLIKSFLSQFDNFLTLLLVFAAVTSLLLGEKIDSLFIFLIVFLNALFGVYQEFKAEKALETLKKLTISTVRVIRDGKEEEIDSRYLVPADIIYVEEGTKIPADCILLKSWHLEVNEASLTGESLPVLKQEKDQENNGIFMGTVVARGRAYAKVENTGEKTKFGNIAKTLSTIKEEATPLQKKLEGFTKQIGIIGIAASLIVFILSFIQEKTLFESFVFAVSLAIAAVPEGLPAVMTITLAIGVEKMAKKKAIVRKLNAIETLGSVTLVATDKTGTLTTNQMAVKKIWVNQKTYDLDKLPLTNQTFSKLVLNGILCSTASIVYKMDHGRFDIIGDATEGALLRLAQKIGLIPQMIRNEWKTTDEIFFNANTKRMTVAVTKAKENFVFTKGAPESIIAIANKILVNGKILNLTAEDKFKIEKDFQEYAKKGLRLIAFSYKTVHEGNLEADQIFLGFVGMADPVREEVKDAVKKANEAGIKVVMITGDNALTAEAIGIETGIIKEGEDILTGKQIDSYTNQQLIGLLSKIKIFSRTTPEHKYRLVKLYQQLGEIVAVTGDGINDALALKQANVGVAMGITGTDVAKETADMIITDDNFATLINAIEQGRNIFNHIKNAIKYLLACNIGEVIYILLAVILKLPVLIPLQLLYINLVTDGLPAISLAFSPSQKDIMRQQPRRTMTLLSSADFKYIFSIGILTALLAFIALIPSNNESTERTIVFTVITFVQPLILVDLWLSHKSISKNLMLLKNPVLIIAFFFPFIIHPFLLYNPFLQSVFKTVALYPLVFVFTIFISFLIFIPHEVFKFKDQKSSIQK